MRSSVSRSTRSKTSLHTTSWVELLNESTSAMDSHAFESSSEDNEFVVPKKVKKTVGKRKKAKGPPKKRRTTYDIRKAQKHELMTEVAKLQRELELLKHRVLMEQGDADKTIERTQVSNAVLQESTQDQHVAIAGMHSMLVSHMQRSLLTSQPTQTVIRLGMDRTERRNTLMAMKDRKLREAERFISAWGQGLDASSSFSQENQFESPGGEFSVIRFDNAPVRGSSVKAVFDAVIHSMQNAEIMISDLFGSITIREDTDFNASDSFQMRLVSSTSHGAVAESNSVIFSEFVDGPDGSYGIVASDFVDADELYPYRSDRVRRNTITIVLIKPLSSTSTTSDDQDVVIATRWTCLKLAQSELEISKEGLRELREISMAWGETIKKCIMQYVLRSSSS